jgi:hypothetical protein
MVFGGECMSVAQIVENIKALSVPELMELRSQLEQTHIFDLNFKMPEIAEVWSPWNELEAAKDVDLLLAEGKL